ncbi:hypothetical protein F0562_020405 [Nyssa sinensis]|uniref:Protein EXORDIUM-like 2 n=1 Tax=Nyssa sinensis TaxID=561372 RepID=A0A5J5BWD0_9ASTE|nr:hypothetical protein F0562_020405 [Nyssa sinensis]
MITMVGPHVMGLEHVLDRTVYDQRQVRIILTLIMASLYRFATVSPFLLLFFFFVIITLVEPSVASTRKLTALVPQQPLILKYHNGALLKGNIAVNLIWYGKFTPIQRSIIVDFLQSLTSPRAPLPSAASWWRTTEKYKGGSSTLVIGKQILDENYSLGKYLKNSHLIALASKASHVNSVNVVLTAKDVGVEGFCMRCGTHGSTRGKIRFAYAWVGNSETQCPGQCAWPFHQPIYGPQTPPLVAPNGDVGVDGMIINIATVLAAAITNPFNNGYFQGPAAAPLEAVSACTGVFGSGAYPGYAGRVLVDKTTGASYNAHWGERAQVLGSGDVGPADICMLNACLI